MKTIRLLVVLVFGLTLSSCSLDDDSPNFHFEALKITEVDLPESFVYGERYEFGITYVKPSSCYIFDGFDYNHTGNLERTVAAIAAVYDDRACTQEETTEEATLKFEVRYKGTYTFRFYTGKNEDTGENEYLIVEVPVEGETAPN